MAVTMNASSDGGSPMSTTEKYRARRLSTPAWFAIEVDVALLIAALGLVVAAHL
jgi:hypothetical protein